MLPLRGSCVVRCLKSCYPCATLLRRHLSEAGRGEVSARGRRLRMTVASASACLAMASGYLFWQQTRKITHAASSVEEPSESESEPPKKHTSFRDRRYIAYEDRIRAYSTPDKVFRYFATLRVVSGEGRSVIFMTPADFVRSITPGALQPENLGLDQFKRVDVQHLERHLKEEEAKNGDESVFSQIGLAGGLISFSDYLFLLTVLSTPKRHFEIAFRMFDLDGDGNVDQQEFDRVCDILTKKTAVGMRHRDNAGNVAKPVGSALAKYFFGADGKRKLTVKEFSVFHDKLQNEILKIEFGQYENEEGLITELDFCKLLLTYTDFSDSKKRAFKKRVKSVFGKGGQGLTFDQYQTFSHFLDHLNEVEIALSMHSAAGAGITRDDLRHVAKSVSGVILDDHLIDTVFAMFDVDRDNTLTKKEFISVLQDRRQRGLNKSKDTGLARLVAAMFSCAKQTVTFF